MRAASWASWTPPRSPTVDRGRADERCWAAMSRALAEVIDLRARSRPGDPAFFEGDRTTTWSEYAARSRALAGALLDLGLAPGERVGVILPDGAGVHAAFVATER